MTEESLTSPWIMFEAGAISKVVEEGRVCPIVFDIGKTDLAGPLAIFQAIAFNETEVRQLLKTINKAAKEAALSERALEEAFSMWWPRLEQKVQAISSASQPPSRPQRSQMDLLQEVVENTRTLIRELQALPPWQRFAPPWGALAPGSLPPDVEATLQALRRQRPLGGGLGGGLLDMDEPRPPDGTVAKSE
jgi:hypothetical protein